MRIKINKLWSLEPTLACIVLHQTIPRRGTYKSGPHKGKPIADEEHQTYHLNFRSALEYLVELDIRSTELKTLREIVTRVEKVRALIESLDLPRGR